MSRSRARPPRAEAGFTLIETLFVVALMGLIVGALAMVTAQWLPSWNLGLLRVMRNEQVAIALDRLAADLSAAEYVSASRRKKAPLFRGAADAVIFVRSALGPNSRPGLEIVQIGEIADRQGMVLTRMRAPFVPLPTGDPAFDPIPFADPVVLLRPPFRIAFAYAGPDGVWVDSWQNTGSLPAAVRIAVRDAAGERDLVVATGARVHAEMMAPEPEAVDEAASVPAQPANAPGAQ